MTTVISIENVSKQYRLGVISNRTLYEDLNRWWARVRGKPDPLMKIGDVDYGNRENDIIWALRNLDLKVEQGQALGIIGRNGAGKSTLLKILSRVTAPTTGIIKARGRISSLLEVGTGFHPELTGRENIYLNGAIHGMSRAEINSKFGEIVSFSEVERYIDTPVKRYSSGMYVRLAFAVAAHLDPEILVVDEVLAVGDAAFQRKCLGKMGADANEGRTILFVSHNIPAVNRLCSRAILLDRGKLCADGPAPQVTAKYLSEAAEESGSVSWDVDNAPGTEDVRLLEVALMGKSGVTKPVFDVSDEITVRLVYKSGKPDLHFRCAIAFMTQGVIAFATVEPTEATRSKTGIYQSTVKVPAHLLSENEYSLTISIFSSGGRKQHYIRLKDAIHFQVYDSMQGQSARGDYSQNIQGVVRPMLEWDVDLKPVE